MPPQALNSVSRYTPVHTLRPVALTCTAAARGALALARHSPHDEYFAIDLARWQTTLDYFKITDVEIEAMTGRLSRAGRVAEVYRQCVNLN